jgi:hypothetical protein
MRVLPCWSVLVILLLGSACGGPTAPAEPPHLRGTVTSVGTQDGYREFLVKDVEFLIGGQQGDRDNCGIYVAADRRTQVWHRTSDGTLRRAALADVQVGTAVEVRHTGFILDSCPAQARAESVVLVASVP